MAFVYYKFIALLYALSWLFVFLLDLFYLVIMLSYCFLNPSLTPCQEALQERAVIVFLCPVCVCLVWSLLLLLYSLFGQFPQYCAFTCPTLNQMRS